MNFLQQYRTVFIVESVLLILLGMLAIAVPFYATLSVELLIGWILLFGGIVQLYKSIKTIKESGGAFSLASALIYIIVGALMLFYPLKGALTLTFLLGLFFLLEGVAKIAISFDLKPAQNWGWILFSGIISLIMSGIILYGWPGTSVWVIGLLVGINMIFFGFSLLALILNIPKDPNTPKI